MKRSDIVFTVWCTAVTIYCLISIGFILAAAYMEVTR